MVSIIGRLVPRIRALGGGGTFKRWVLLRALGSLGRGTVLRRGY
jgi:hypothetical protein